MLKTTEVILRTIISILFIFIISSSLYFNQNIEVPKKLYIPKGSSKKIITYLNKTLGNHFFLTDRFMLNFFGYPQHGWLKMPQKQISRYELLQYITKAKAINENLMLIPGETTKIFLYNIARKQNKNFKEVYQYYKNKSPLEEGFLIPETYKISLHSNYKKIIDYLITFAKNHHNKDMENLKIYSFDDWKRILIIASIIEKESGSIEEMSLIASVIYNRLEKNMKLQMDGTLNYGFNSHKKITSDMIKNDNTKYNTYKFKGLPQLPICNPSSQAIESALFPKDTKYLYFMKIKGTNRHKFTSSYKEHLYNIKRNK